MRDPLAQARATAAFQELGKRNPALQKQLLNLSVKTLDGTENFSTFSLKKQYKDILRDGPYTLDFLKKAYTFYDNESARDDINHHLFEGELEIFERLIDAFIRHTSDITNTPKEREGLAKLAINSKPPKEYVTALRTEFTRHFSELIASLGDKSPVIVRLQLLFIHLFSSLRDELTNFSTKAYTGYLSRFPERANEIAFNLSKLAMKHFASSITDSYQNIILHIATEKAAANEAKAAADEAKRLEEERLAAANLAAKQQERELLNNLEKEKERARKPVKITKSRGSSSNTNNLAKMISTLAIAPNSPPVVEIPNSSTNNVVPNESAKNLQDLLLSIKAFKSKYSHLSTADIIAAIESINTNTNNNSNWKETNTQSRLKQVTLTNPSLIAARNRGKLPRTLLSFIQDYTPEKLANYFKTILPALKTQLAEDNITLLVTNNENSVYINVFRTKGSGGGAGSDRIAHISFHLGVNPEYNTTEWKHIHIKDDIAGSESGITLNVNYSPSYVFSPADYIGSPSEIAKKLASTLSSITIPSFRSPSLRSPTSSVNSPNTRKKGRGGRRRTRR